MALAEIYQDLFLQSDNDGSIKGADKEEPKEIIATKVTGTVKWFNVKSGYGFINRNDTKEDVFVHQTAIIKNNPKKAVRSVGDGEVVEFDVVVGEKGNEASNVSGPEGVPVKGSPYAADRRRGSGGTRGRRGARFSRGGRGAKTYSNDRGDASGSGDDQEDGQGDEPISKKPIFSPRGRGRGTRGFRPRGFRRGGGGTRFGNPKYLNKDGDSEVIEVNIHYKLKATFFNTLPSNRTLVVVMTTVWVDEDAAVGAECDREASAAVDFEVDVAASVAFEAVSVHEAVAA